MNVLGRMKWERRLALLFFVVFLLVALLAHIAQAAPIVCQSQAGADAGGGGEACGCLQHQNTPQ